MLIIGEIYWKLKINNYGGLTMKTAIGWIMVFFNATARGRRITICISYNDIARKRLHVRVCPLVGCVLQNAVHTCCWRVADLAQTTNVVVLDSNGFKTNKLDFKILFNNRRRTFFYAYNMLIIFCSNFSHSVVESV